MDCLFLEIFPEVMKDWNLQFPTSTTVVKAKNYVNFVENNDYKYFFCNNDGSVTMKACGHHKRCEFRNINDFNVETDEYKILKITSKLDIGSQEKETTIAQIHDDGNTNGINKPLLRISLIKNRNGIKNHFWAVFITNTDLNHPTYEHYDLGPYECGYINWKILVKDSVVTVKRNDETKCKQDVSYYNGIDVYFKFGIYNQGDGCDSNTISYMWTNSTE